MHWLTSVLLAIQVVTSLSIIVLVLLQQGKGADMGSSFGSGSAGSLFGSSGAANFLSRATKWAAIVFFASTIGLAYLSHHTTDSILDGGIMKGFTSEPAPAPVVPQGSAVPVVPGSGSAVPGNTDAVPAAGAAIDSSSAVPSVPSAPPAVPPATSGAAVPSMSDSGDNAGVPGVSGTSSGPAPTQSGNSVPTGE